MSHGARLTLIVATSLLAAYAVYRFCAKRPPEPPEDGDDEGGVANDVEPEHSANSTDTNALNTLAAPKVGVYYASQTGTAERLAKTLASFMAKWHTIFEPDAVNLEDWKEDYFSRKGALAIFLVSTHDDGLFPDNATKFVKWLRKCNKEGPQLDGLSFCIFGLGSSEYPLFNQAAKNLQSILKKLGSHEFMPIALGDDILDLKSDFLRWKSNLCTTLSAKLGIDVPIAEASSAQLGVFPNDSWRNRAQLELRYVDIRDDKQEFEPKISDVICRQQWQCMEHEVLENVCMTPEDDGQTHCIVLKSHEAFKCAETANVLYANPPEVVEYFINRLNLKKTDMEKVITFVPRYGRRDEGASFDAPFPVPCTLKDALWYYLDLTGLPSVEVLSDLGTFLRTPHECDRLNRLIASEGLLKRMREELHVTLVEFVEIFMPGVIFNLGGFLQLVPPKVPKPYTISSHPKTEMIALTVKLVHYSTHSLKSFKKTIERMLDYKPPNTDEGIFRMRRFYKGACTHFLCSVKPGDMVKMYRRPSAFSNVEGLENKPIIMIANGAGHFGKTPTTQCNAFYSLGAGIRTTCSIGKSSRRFEAVITSPYISHSPGKRIAHMYNTWYEHTLQQSVTSYGMKGSFASVGKSKQMGAQVKAILQRFMNADIATMKERGQYIEELW
ncbi:flavodoxin and oxidoreductase NAD-binding domain containing protein [Babesia divergens]|uniref:Flavodoxin and oxidoreductase NAD-binding domain containing protein n=1 Tax=Babesia divergens TaxID=32595 RepID=A0AAD9LMD8_BABDI|nr:flavodoxin and oxidoreductase NAD-binding domain containing protein [Babesia divergens]